MRRWEYWTSSAIALSCLCVVLFNGWLSASVRGNQQLVNERQRFIAQSVQLSRLNTEIIQALARLAVAHDDSAIKALLSAQGISYSAPPTGATIETGDLETPPLGGSDSRGDQ